jgi:hypothetical protein
VRVVALRLEPPARAIEIKPLINYPAASGRGSHRNLANFAKGSLALILNFFEASLGEFDPQRLKLAAIKRVS